MKMTVLYLRETGHVMAACTRATLIESPPEEDDGAVPSAEVRALVGDALPGRSLFDPVASAHTDSFSVPAAFLKALTVEASDDQLLSPRRYMVVDKELKSGLWAHTTTTPTFTYADESITISLSTDFENKELPFVLLIGGPEFVSLEGVFDTRDDPNDPPEFQFAHKLNMSDISWAILLLKGYQPIVDSISISS